MKQLRTTLLVCALAIPVIGQAQALGTWADVSSVWPAFAIHLAHLPDGSVLFMNRHRAASGGRPEILFKPYVANGTNFATTTQVANDLTESFCCGFLPLQDGTLLIAGGHNMSDGYGRTDIWIFDPTGQTWNQQSSMGLARWYPSCVFLPNRRVMVFSGSIDGTPYNTNANRPTIWLGNVNPGGDPSDAVYTFASSMAHSLDLYFPQVFIDPMDGNLFVCGKGISADSKPQYGNEKLDLATLQWTTPYLPLNASDPSDYSNNVRWEYPSAVMINGRIVRTGGSKQDNTLASDCSKRTLWIDLN